MRFLLYALAAVGALCLVGVVLLYLQGWMVVREFDPRATQVFGEFARRTLESDVASANVFKLPVAEDVSIQEAIASMKLRANKLNIKLVSRLPFSKEIQARTGEPYPYLEIFLFCDAGIAARLLSFDPDFVAYMPCSIALYEDPEGQAWLSTMNLDMLIYGGPAMDPGLREQVVQLRDGMLEVMAAGAAGAL